MGFCTSGSAAKTVALKPGGSFICAATWAAGSAAEFVSGSELNGRGKSAASAGSAAKSSALVKANDENFIATGSLARVKRFVQSTNR